MGIIIGNFWGYFWAIVFLTIGIKMLIHKEGHSLCEGFWWNGKMHERIQKHCDCSHDHDEDGHDHH
jgi:hypothetical protein